jgi:hypothetical protein
MTETGLVFLNFGHCDLFDICDLLFGIFGTPVFQQTAASGQCKAGSFGAGFFTQQVTRFWQYAI